MQKTHTFPISATHTLVPAGPQGGGQPPSSLGADCCAPGLPENKGARRMEQVPPLSPLLAPRIKGPYLSDFT